MIRSMHRRRPRYRSLARRTRPAAIKPPGATPGTLAIDPSWPASALTLLAFGPDRFEERTADSLAGLRLDKVDLPVKWINVDGLGAEAVLREVGQRFKLHPLALEDVVSLGQRPKLEPYDDVLYLVAPMIRLVDGQEVAEQVSFFAGPGFVLTFQLQAGDCFEPIRKRIRAGSGLVRRRGADYLLYALLDAMVDAYFPVVARYDTRIEGLEAAAVQGQPDSAVVHELTLIRQDLQRVQRSLWPLRDAVVQWQGLDAPLVDEATRPYLRDCEDHLIRLIDLVESVRETSLSLTELHLAMVSLRTNEVMKVLTIIATIFIPLTFIVGVYGMNFDIEASPWNMPELYWRYGYPGVMVFMAVISAAMLVGFRRRGWLGRPSKRGVDG